MHDNRYKGIFAEDIFVGDLIMYKSADGAGFEPKLSAYICVARDLHQAVCLQLNTNTVWYAKFRTRTGGENIYWRFWHYRSGKLLNRAV